MARACVFLVVLLLAAVAMAPFAGAARIDVVEGRSMASADAPEAAADAPAPAPGPDSSSTPSPAPSSSSSSD
ncbi:hypothetical protein ZEAMMB73_Zm00001d004602 [Zea mays]|jgi:hypothetical protein|uniref:Uncharacterized protein n=1 Tax=Zea mays TaxID=4577 RepID=A0A1D6EGH6_MAIZE|nr:hypothetical protein ZEAMMB73_Zm00001d004602 [Zea mays]